MKFARLGEVADFRAGFGFPIIHQGLSDGDYPFAKVGDISEVVRRGQNTISTTPNYITTETLKKIHAKALPPGSIVFAKIGEAIRQNFRAITATDMVVDNNVMGMVPDSSQIDTMYLFQFMKQLDLYQFATATSVPALRKSRLEEIPIPLPPLPEQRRIAAVLDAADALRAKRRAALGKLDALLQSVFLEMFGDPVRNERGWEVTKLDNVVSYIGSGVTPLGGSSVYSTEGQLFIRSQNVLMFDFDFSDAAYIDDPMHQDMRRTWVKHNDVLLNITGASIGRVNFYSGKDDSANVNQHVCIIRPIDQRILPAYLTYHLGMPSYQNKIIGQNAGATRQAFNFKQIRDFNLMLPPLRLQSRFSDAWEKVRGLRQRQHCAYEKQVRLFHSLQQRAFRGEL